jgi:hypothetical protein
MRSPDALAGPRLRGPMSGVADESGVARFEIPKEVAARLRGTYFAACLVHRGGRGPSSQRILTDVTSIEIVP